MRFHASQRVSERSPPEADMWIVRLALRRPYTFVVLSLLIALLGIGSAIEAPKDIYPYIDIPVVTIVWSYTGLTPTGDGGPHCHGVRARADHTVNDIEHTEVRELPGRRCHSRLLPAEGEGGAGDGPDDGRRADDSARPSAGTTSAEHPQVRRIDRCRSCSSALSGRD